MASRENLDEAINDLVHGIEDEVFQKWRQTRFNNRTGFLQDSIHAFVKDDGLTFQIVNYAEFLDQGTRYIEKDPFITPVLQDEDGSIEEVLTNAFEQDINDTINNTARTGGAEVS